MANPMYGQNKADNALDEGSVVATKVNRTLTLSEAGSTVILLDGAGYTVKLPVPKRDGVTFDFIYGGAAAEAHDITIDTQSDTRYLLGALQGEDTDSTGDSNAIIAPNGSSNSKVALKTVEPGTWLKAVSVGGLWYLIGAIYGATATFAVYADQ